MFNVLLEVLCAVLVVRIGAGWVRHVRWRPQGDPLLVGAMEQTRPRISSRVACATVDLNPGRQRARFAYNHCDRNTVFEVGSLSKALTGLLLADAIERGEITAHTTLDEVWTDLQKSRAGEVTIGELAHHTSGLPRQPMGATRVLRLVAFAYGGLDPDRGLRLSALLRFSGRARRRQAGTFHYSNLGGSLAGHAVAARAASTYTDLIEERLAGPLGMALTSADPRAARSAGRGWLGAWVQPWRADGYAPAGGVTSTIGDMTGLCQRLLDGTAPGMAALDHGLFWQIFTAPNGYRQVWHNGETGGYSSYLAVYPEAKKAVIVLAAHANAAQQGRLAAACVRAIRTPDTNRERDTTEEWA
jgi:CubicO group peptidase (beta-lactamase class C family)